MSERLKVFVDADVLFAGSAAPSEHSASLTILQLGELTLLDCVTSKQAIIEVERNLAEKIPTKISTFRKIVQRSLRILPDPAPNELERYAGQADAEDLPILVAALREECVFLLTFNVRHFHPASRKIKVLRPGDFILAVREGLIALSREQVE